MNSRIIGEETPEGRIAAVVKTLIAEMREKFRKRIPEYREPDYADLRDAIKPYLELEICRARIAEVNWSRTIDFRSVRMRELQVEEAKIVARLGIKLEEDKEKK